jgi:predicted RNase H-like nuclease (RuvC/YqgF family)
MTSLNNRGNVHIRRSLARMERIIERQKSLFSLLQTILEMCMKTPAEYAAELETLKTAIADDQAGDQAIVDRLDEVIVQLKAKIDELGATQDFESLFQEIENIKSTIKPVVSATPATPAPEPGETEIPIEG